MFTPATDIFAVAYGITTGICCAVPDIVLCDSNNRRLHVQMRIGWLRPSVLSSLQ